METKKNFYYQGRALTHEEAVAELKDILMDRLGENVFCVTEFFPYSRSEYVMQQLNDILTNEIQYIAAHDDWLRLYLFFADVLDGVDSVLADGAYMIYKFKRATNGSLADWLLENDGIAEDMLSDIFQGKCPPEEWIWRDVDACLTVSDPYCARDVAKKLCEFYPNNDISDYEDSEVDDGFFCVCNISSFRLLVDVDRRLDPDWEWWM